MTRAKTYTRRELLQTAATGALAAGGSLIGANALVPAAGFANSRQPARLKIPPLYVGRDEAGTKVYDLALQNGSTEFYNGFSTRTSGINGSYLGPTLKMRNGSKVRINVANELAEVSTLHWHGVHLPASQDGGPHQVIDPGETWSPEFIVKQKAASLWYHPHHIGKTAEHVWRGMAGMLIVEDEEADALGLPGDYGTDDIPLVLQDRVFSGNGGMDYGPTMHAVMMGMIGDTPLANGTISAFFEAHTKLVRFRILNGSNASIYNLGFGDDRRFLQIASDGGLLESPVELTRLLLAPGERAEIIVELAAGEHAILHNFHWDSQQPRAGGMGGMMGGRMGGMMGGSATSQEFDFLEIRAADDLIDALEIPRKLVDVDRLNEADATVTRTFELQMNMGPGVMMGFSNPHLINGKVMNISRIDETVELGATELWEIRNASSIPHPFHIHDVQFQILDRSGRQPKPGERGRKDVVLVHPGESVRLIMKFEDYADPNSPFMYHCHILEHEDAGMMGQFVVV